MIHRAAESLKKIFAVPLLTTAIAIAVVAAISATVAGDQVQRRLTSHAADDRCPRWAPDGSRIVFESNRSGSWDLWSIRPDGSRLERLTDHQADDRFPTWSPAGGRIAFVSDRAGTPDLYTLDVATGRTNRVAAWPGRESFPDWSPGGRRLAFTLERDGELHIWVVAVDGGTPRPLTTGAHRFVWPRWAPQVESIACFTRAYTDGEEDDIALIDPAGGRDPVRVTRSSGHDYCPAWDPSGRTLVWVAVSPVGERHLVRGTRQGRVEARFGRGFEGVTEPDVASRGGMVAYAARSGDRGYDIWVENLPRTGG